MGVRKRVSGRDGWADEGRDGERERGSAVTNDEGGDERHSRPRGELGGRI